jgi:uncharacterized protein YbcI
MATQQQAEREIGERIAALHSSYYGTGPTSAAVYLAPGAVVVVLEETFTQAERKLIERGEAEGLQAIRRRFQQAVAEEFIQIVSEATGQSVRAFFSDTNLEQHISVETFVLGKAMEDMTAFQEDYDQHNHEGEPRG